MSKPTLSQFLRYVEQRREMDHAREAQRLAGEAWLQGVTNSIPSSKPKAAGEEPYRGFSHKPLTTNYLMGQKQFITNQPKPKRV